MRCAAARDPILLVAIRDAPRLVGQLGRLSDDNHNAGLGFVCSHLPIGDPLQARKLMFPEEQQPDHRSPTTSSYADRVNCHFGGGEGENAMRRSLEQSVRAVLAASLGIALVVEPAFAVERHKSIDAEPGTPVRVANHMHFRVSTCEAISIPKIILRQRPSKGRVTITEGLAPLRSARSERAERCIGIPMMAATVRYTPFANSKGEDTLAYDVIFPPSCTHCRNQEVSVAISIEDDLEAVRKAWRVIEAVRSAAAAPPYGTSQAPPQPPRIPETTDTEYGAE
jgi:hypothetical protein